MFFFFCGAYAYFLKGEKWKTRIVTEMFFFTWLEYMHFCKNKLHNQFCPLFVDVSQIPKKIGKIQQEEKRKMSSE